MALLAFFAGAFAPVFFTGAVFFTVAAFFAGAAFFAVAEAFLVGAAFFAATGFLTGFFAAGAGASGLLDFFVPRGFGLAF